MKYAPIYKGDILCCYTVFSLVLDSLFFMPPSPTSKFAQEGGKLYLAEALFDRFKLEIRCPRCPGNPSRPGFIKDEAGKGADGRPRRQWACQRSNSRSSLSYCPRVSCTEYIELARQQVDQDDFNNTLQHTCQNVSNLDFVATLKAYLIYNPPPASLTSTPQSQTQAMSSTQPKKRKAKEELPTLDKSARHSMVQERQGAKGAIDDLQHLPAVLGQLKVLIEMSKTWQEQHNKLSLFLASSPYRPPLPTEMPSSSLPDIGLLSSSLPLPNVSQPKAFPSDATILCTSSPGLSAGAPSVLLHDILQEAEPLSDTRIPSTCVEGKGSSPPQPSPPPLKGPVDLLPSTTRQNLSSAVQRFPTSIRVPVLPKMHTFFTATGDKDKQAKELVDSFRQTLPDTEDGRKKRAEIRKQAKDSGLQSLFNSLLNSSTRVRSQFTKPPRFLPPRPELKCSDRK